MLRPKRLVSMVRGLDEAATRRIREPASHELFCTITSLHREAVILPNFVRTRQHDLSIYHAL